MLAAAGYGERRRCDAATILPEPGSARTDLADLSSRC
jgi:hypothetical protein